MRSFHGGPTDRKGYHHGNLKEALGEAAGRGFTLLAERLGRAVRGGGTPLERFTRMGEAYLAFAEEEPGFYAAMFSPRGGEDQGVGVWGPPPGAEATRQSG